MIISNMINHLKTIVKHRHLVMKYCFKAGIPIQGLLHDLSKYSPSEFWVGVKYYQGTRSPNVAERQDKGFSSAWMHHKGRNKHHHEYWFDNDRSPIGLKPVEMETKYVIEMFCDRVAASKVYKGDEYTDSTALDYFNGHDHRINMHPNTKELIQKLLQMLADEGEEKTFEYIKKMKK
ncbi:MAG: catalase [Ruminococcaceae bacterium]|nr:catalase [Oscillospiraceae bacterium]